MVEQVQDDKKFTGIRLPTEISPSRYELHLEPNLKDFSFTGKVKISLDFKDGVSRMNELIVHSKELVIKDGYLENSPQADSKNPLKKVTYSNSSETATLEFSHPVDSSMSALYLNFDGILNDKLKGFYRTSFEIDGQKVHAATTQFESVDARSCLPCWDEPAVKAYFSVTIVHDSKMKIGNKELPIVAISNTNEKSSSETADGKRTVTFEDTPKMSTYLLAFIVGPFEKLSASDGRRPISVYTTPGKVEQARFALEVACKSLPWYEDYFSVPYPLPKLDLIALPDFASGAMENWGLVTYRETCMLVDPGNTSQAAKHYVAIVVAHELAHQWFGNLVTMEWWTNLWLNEGFATFMEFLCVDRIYPEFNIWNRFVTDSLYQAMTLDSMNNSHPIEIPIKHPSEIEEIFDAISYQKGSSVIRMLYEYIGDAKFREGMKNYLEKYAYKNAITEDLWDSLEEASQKPIRKLMSDWISLKGFPWISVSYTRENGTYKLNLTQAKFSADGKISGDECKMKWTVPISAMIGSQSGTRPRVVDLGLLDECEKTFTVENVGDNWIKINAGTVNFYHAAYPKDLIEKLKPAITDKSLPSVDRLGIQDDYFALCKAGKLATVDYLGLLKSFQNEDDYVVWSSISGCIGELNSRLRYTDYQDKFDLYCRQLYSDIYKKMSWVARHGEKEEDPLTRAIVISRLISSHDQDAIGEAKRRFKLHVDDVEAISADLRGPVYRAVAKHGDVEQFEQLFKLYGSTDLHEEKRRILSGLTNTQDEALLERVIEFIMSEQVRNQDKPMSLLSLGVAHPQRAWRFLRDNIDFLIATYGNTYAMSIVINGCSGNFASDEMADELEQFFSKLDYDGQQMAIKRNVELARQRSGWIKREAESVKAFLSG